MTPLGILEALGGLLGVGSLIGAVVVYGRVNGLQASVSLFSQANTELRAGNEAGQIERGAMRAEFTEKLHTQELECAKQIARLEGQVAALTDGLADRIINAVMTGLQNASPKH